MVTEIQPIALPGGVRLHGTAASAARFLWHFVQMVVAMEAGMLVYHVVLSPLLQPTPYGALTDAYPIVGYWGMVVSMVLGMLALMVYHRSSGHYSLEMTAAMLAPVAALTVLVLCSLIPSHVLYAAGDPLMFLAMAAYMLYRPHKHSHGGHGHAGHEHVSMSQADTIAHSAHGG